MIDPYKIVLEAVSPAPVKFIFHKHNPRNGSLHYDIRFVDPRNPKILHSFACPSNFVTNKDIVKRSMIVKTREHDPRWLTLKSYRLTVMDEGEVDILVATKKFFKLDFKGTVLTGRYDLFKKSGTKRDDIWILINRGD